jgi:hypothetical protein
MSVPPKTVECTFRAYARKRSDKCLPPNVCKSSPWRSSRRRISTGRHSFCTIPVNMSDTSVVALMFAENAVLAAINVLLFGCRACKCSQNQQTFPCSTAKPQHQRWGYCEGENIWRYFSTLISLGCHFPRVFTTIFYYTLLTKLYVLSSNSYFNMAIIVELLSFLLTHLS